jgi:membrane protein YqaA with SNARE-associated domain
MSAVLVSLIAVAGTLLGSLTTYLFQRQTARHTEATARAERLRQDRRVACGDFIAAVTEVKRAVITAWFRRDTETTPGARPRPTPTSRVRQPRARSCACSC